MYNRDPRAWHHILLRTFKAMVYCDDTLLIDTKRVTFGKSYTKLTLHITNTGQHSTNRPSPVVRFSVIHFKANQKHAHPVPASLTGDQTPTYTAASCGWMKDTALKKRYRVQLVLKNRGGFHFLHPIQIIPNWNNQSETWQHMTSQNLTTCQHSIPRSLPAAACDEQSFFLSSV